ncbi:hypothetical protein DPX16_23615 [Anabarilius grahami]|uniref:Uncharacterized protein n=1 Tax=Anabarilius grahami TaxID=495550 RepID=A0A3N0ZC90_ANAGA|nr:hypothetical protein DPX16_23615 [Anabarilius grahami]
MQSTNSEYGSPYLATCHFTFTFIIQRRLDPWIPWLRLLPMIQSLQLGLSSRVLRTGFSPTRLHLGPSAIRLHQAPSTLQLHLGRTSPRLCHGLASLLLRAVSPPLWLRPPSGSASAHSRCSSTSDLWHPGSTSGDRRHASVAASKACGIVPGHRLSICTLGSFSTSSVSIHHPHDLVDLHRCSSFPRLRRGASSWLDSGFSTSSSCSWSPLAPPTFHSPHGLFSVPWTLSFWFSSVLRPPPEPPPSLPPHLDSYGARMRLPGRGQTVTYREVLQSASEACFGASSDRAENAGSLVDMDLECTASEHNSHDDRSNDELLEVIIRAVDSLQLDWPQEQETPRRSK